MAARTDTFLGQRHRRIVKRRGKLKALVAVARAIPAIVWHLMADPNARFHDLGPDYHTTRIATQRKLRSHINQLAALLPSHPRTRRLNPHPQRPNNTRPHQLHRVPSRCPLTLVIFRSALWFLPNYDRGADVGGTQMIYQVSQCAMSSTGSRLAGRKSVPLV